MDNTDSERVVFKVRKPKQPKNARKKDDDENQDERKDIEAADPAPGSLEEASKAATADEAESPSISIDDIIELRKLRKRTNGVGVNDLLRGDPKLARERAEQEEKKDADPWKLGSGGLVDLNKIKGISVFGSQSSDNSSFATASQDMDRSKHMNAFVERELMKKRGQSLDSPVDGESSSPQTQNPTDELFDIPENLRVKDSALPEGNVTLSASMLTAIPEIDLGIDIKLKNIAETEQAKQKLSGRKHTKKDLLDYSQNVTAAERFMTARYHQQQRSDHSQQHGRNSNHGNSDNHSRSQGSESRGHRSDRRSMATDDIVMERFKKRMRR